MSFYTSLTGLKAATTELSITSNNIANVATSGFKKSRASFGDIFATSPLQKSTAVVGQGVSCYPLGLHLRIRGQFCFLALDCLFV